MIRRPPRSTLFSLHDALPISAGPCPGPTPAARSSETAAAAGPRRRSCPRSEEHTSELQSRLHLVCRLLLEKKKNHISRRSYYIYKSSHLLNCVLHTADA